MSRLKCGFAVAALLLLAPASLLAAGDAPTPAKALFETRHLDLIGKGAEVTYKFERTVSDETVLGKAFQDDIRLGVLNVNDKGEREVEIKVFSGDQARNPQNWPDLTINPLFVWYLDRAVVNFRAVAGGSPPYLKDKFRKGFLDKAKIEEIQADFNGKSIPAFRITISPYAGDISANKMRGFDESKFAIVVSNDVPGYFLDLTSTFESKLKGQPKLFEHLSLVGMGAAK